MGLMQRETTEVRSSEDRRNCGNTCKSFASTGNSS